MRSDKIFGDYGEKIVKYYFESKNFEVEMSTDSYDMEKDLFIVNGDKFEQIEVKTTVVYENAKYEGSFQPCVGIKATTIDGVNANQIVKCCTVDRLIWVVAPWAMVEQDGTYKYYGTAQIFELLPEDRKQFRWNDGSYLVPLSSLQRLQPLNEKATNNLLNLTTTRFRTEFKGYKSQYCLQ